MSNVVIRHGSFRGSRLAKGLLVVSAMIVSSLGFAQAESNYRTLIDKGNTQLQAGNAQSATTIGEAAIHEDASRWEGYALAGGALMNLKRYEEATDMLSKAIEKAPESKQPALRELRRQSLVAESRSSATAATPVPAATISQAEVVLWKSIESSHNSGDFQTYIDQYPHGAFVALAQRHLVEAKYPPDGISLSSVPTRTGVLSRDLAKPIIASQKAMQDKNYDEAIADLRAAQADPVPKSDYDNFTITSRLAFAYLNEHRQDDALPLLLQAARSDYASPVQQMQWLKGVMMICFAQKDFSRSLAIANEAAAHGAGDPAFLEVIAEAQLALGKYTDAVLTMQVAVNRQVNPDEKMLGLLKDMKSKAETAGN
jgi:tetratricopeptide (TPR) repeat protein